MKQLIILSLSVLCFSCTKTNVNYKTIEKHYTTIIKPTLIGTWTDNQSSHPNPIFTGSTIQCGIESPYYYLTSSDTIYAHYLNATVFPEFTYKINDRNDTLTLSTIVNVLRSYTYVYHRI